MTTKTGLFLNLHQKNVAIVLCVAVLPIITVFLPDTHWDLQASIRSRFPWSPVSSWLSRYSMTVLPFLEQ